MFDEKTLKYWAGIVISAFVVGVGDYLLTNASGDWKESATKAGAAGLLAAWPIVRKALSTPPPTDE